MVSNKTMINIPPTTKITTGIEDLDKMTGGLKGGDLAVFAGRSSMGKTRFLLDVASYIVDEYDLSVMIFSLNMFKAMVRKFLTADRKKQAKMVLIDDRRYDDIEQIRISAEEARLWHRIDAIFIDNVHCLIDPHTSLELKAMAVELKLPVICTTKLVRSNVTGTNTPQPQDMKYPPGLNVRADLVAMLHREDFYHRDEVDYASTSITELLVNSNRKGPTGKILLKVDLEVGRFRQIREIIKW